MKKIMIIGMIGCLIVANSYAGTTWLVEIKNESNYKVLVGRCVDGKWWNSMTEYKGTTQINQYATPWIWSDDLTHPKKNYIRIQVFDGDKMIGEYNITQGWTEHVYGTSSVGTMICNFAGLRLFDMSANEVSRLTLTEYCKIKGIPDRTYSGEPYYLADADLPDFSYKLIVDKKGIPRLEML